MAQAADRPKPVAIVLVAAERRPLSQALAVQLVYRLRDQDPNITPALTWLDERLAIQDTTADTVVRDVHRQQGAANVSVRNIITSLRLISDVDWKELFERLSLVDAVLATDSNFGSMDFPTRTLYRTAVEELSRGSNLTELEIASAAVLAAKQAGADAPPTEQPDEETPDTFCSRAGAATSKKRSPIACPCETGRRASTDWSASAAI